MENYYELDIPRPILKQEDLHRKYLLNAPIELVSVEDHVMTMPWIAPVPNTSKWVLVKDYNYRGIIIPAGFVFDGASIPKIFGWLYQKSDPMWIIAALVHDWLYFTKMYPRWVGDSFFEEILLKQGNPPLRARIFHRAVRLGGGSAYKEVR